MTRLIEFLPLELTNHRVEVKWIVTPETPIYRQTGYYLDFGEALDPRTVPLKVWWTTVLLSLHSHWNLLRPCRVVLPIRLESEEIEFWSRLLDVERVTIEKYGQSADFARSIEIVAEGDCLAEVEPTPESGRFATAYSGGKDSLVQAALLCEFTERPLLVNTYSPMEPLLDHDWPFRHRAMAEMRARRNVELVEVKSDLRSIWPHYDITHSLGYKIGMAQLTDPYLFGANAIAVAYSRGVRHVTLAAEYENNVLDLYHDRMALQDFNFNSALPILGAIDGRLQRWGMRYYSLIAPFSGFQGLELIRKRYADLGDIQISCFWITDDTQQYCCRCYKCLRIGTTLLALGEDPASLGIKLDILLETFKDYDAVANRVVSYSVPYACSRINLSKVRRFLPNQTIWQRLGWSESESFKQLKQLIAINAPQATPGLAQTHPDYFAFIPPPLRGQMEKLSRRYWPEIDPTDKSAELSLTRETIDWITETQRDAKKISTAR